MKNEEPLATDSMIDTLRDRPSALIFDLDGTLLDTEPLYTIASQRVLDPYDQVFSPELKKRCIGRDSRQSAQITIDHASLPLSVDEYLARTRSLPAEPV